MVLCCTTRSLHLLLFFLCVFLATATRKVVNIQAVAGDPVYLPCDIASTDQDDHVLLVLWYREDLGTPIYSVDGRDRDFSIAERWSDENTFANRAYFIPDKQPAELGIDHIRESDNGVYRCRVDFKIAQTRNSKVNLTVIVPPQKIVIMDESGMPLTSVVGPFAEGASFLLRCDVFGAKPPPNVMWFRNEKEITNSSMILPNGGTSHVRSELKIVDLRRKDLHTELTCQASNNERSPPLAATLHVDMNFGPLNVNILGANQPLSVDRRYDLLCQSSGSRPPATITWWKNGQRLERTKETTSINGNTTTSTLSFTPQKDDDGKYLSCRAENKVISEEGLEDGWKLEIHYSPEAKIVLGSSLTPGNIREGTDVYFDCVIDAHPSVYKVEWKINGKLLPINVNAGIIISNQSLVLQSVSRSTAGNYTCVGYNAEGDGESEEFYLDVLYAPRCQSDQIRIYGVAKQEKAEVSCKVDANPSEVNFRWTFNNSADSVDVAQYYITKLGTSSIVSYTPRTELDYGTLLCYASNKIGIQKMPCLFHIIAAGRPDQVHNCTIFNVSTMSLSIKCSEGFSGGLPQSFLFELKQISSSEVIANFTSPIPRFSMTDLEPNTQYQVLLCSYNAKGRSEPVIYYASTLRLPEKQHTVEKENQRFGFKFTPMTSVFIGIVLALLIVALVVILVLRLQCLHHNQKNKQNKNMFVTNRIVTDPQDCINKIGDTPLTKEDSDIGECDNDEKNPDIIPQPEDVVDYGRKKQHISTIETLPRNIQGIGNSSSSYLEFCTLRNGVPLYGLTRIKVGQKQDAHSTSSSPHQPGQTVVGIKQYPPNMQTYIAPSVLHNNLSTSDVPIALRSLATTSDKDFSLDVPVIVNKKESAV